MRLIADPISGMIMNKRGSEPKAKPFECIQIEHIRKKKHYYIHSDSNYKNPKII